MERCPTQAVLPLVGLAAEKVIRDRYNKTASAPSPFGSANSSHKKRKASWATEDP
ncbi:MAG: hypothetical protein ACQESR_00960 [Planctomycetota bacterium]